VNILLYLSPICKSILAGLDQAVMVTDLSGQICYQNPAAERLTGMSLDEASAAGWNFASGQEGSFRLGGQEIAFRTYPVQEGSQVIGSSVYLRPLQDEQISPGIYSPQYFEAKGAHVRTNEPPRSDTDDREAADPEVKERDMLLAGVAVAANTLLMSRDSDAEIYQAREILGLSARVDRILVYEHRVNSNGGHEAGLKYQWEREEISSRQGDRGSQNSLYDYILSGRHGVLSSGDVVTGPLPGFLEQDSDPFRQRGVQSLMAVPIFKDGKFWGIISFEDCHDRKSWSKSEISSLKVAAGSIGETMERRERDDELRGTRDFLENLIDHANAAIIVWDPSFRITRFNRAFERLTGWTGKDVVGKHLEILFPPQSLGKSLAHIRRALSGERWEALEIPILRTDGQVRTVLWNSATIYDKDGRTVLATIAQGQDITERKEAEAELRRTRDYLENLIEYANAPIIVWDSDFKISRFNHAVERLTGLFAGEVIGQPLDILFPAKSRIKSMDHIRRTLSGERWDTVEIPILGKDGSIRTVLWNSATLYEEDGKTVLATIAQGQNITERKAAEEQVKFQASLLDQVHNAIIATDLNGRIAYWNKFAETLHQWTAEEVLGKNIAETVVPEGSTDRMIQVMDQISSSGSLECELKVRRRDGSIFPAYYSFSTLKDSQGENAGFVGVSIDITERKEVEEDLRRAKERAEAATRAKSRFLASMSHEIRTPMNAVVGLAGLMLKTDLSPDQRDYAETIRSSGDALMTIINDILDFSKIEGGKMEMECQPFDLVNCVEESVDLIAQSAAKKSLSLSYFVDSQVPHRIVGDVTRLRQVLINLLSNAVKFTDAGEISVAITSRKSGQRYEIQFAVKDTGIGISADRTDRLFQHFSQVDMSINRKYGGTGLGLAISKRLVEMMGGKIWVKSEPGRGSTFFFTIAAIAARLPAEELKGKRILIMVEDPGVAQDLSGQLLQFSVKPIIASPQDWAVHEINRDSADLLIIDMETEGAKELIMKRGSAALPPMVAFRPHSGPEGPFAGALEHPIRPASLVETLTEALRKPVQRSVSDMPSSPRECRSLRILLAEDNAVNQKVALRMLERLGYQADIAANGFEVAAALRLQPYDLVLMDVQMPEMDGLEATRLIRAMKDIRQPYIIAMTAFAMKGDREECLSAGMDDYIAKPVKIEELEAALEPRRELSEAVDRKALDELRKLQMDDEPDVLEELIGMYLERAPRRIAALREALKNGDSKTLHREAHDFKSSSASLGALRLSAICKDLEAMGRSGQLQDALKRIADAEAELVLVKEALEYEISRK